MSRERLAQAFDKAAEAMVELALELRTNDSAPVRADAPAAGAPPPAPAPAAPLPPKRQIDESAFTECPAHHKAWIDGRYGKYCPAQSDEPNWSNDKGYCRVTPRSAGAWIKQHPQGPPVAAAVDVDDMPF